MNVKTHRQNHDFQIAYFLAGSCHTPDGAYAMLCDLKEDRESALKAYEVGTLRMQAKVLRAEALLQDATLPKAARLDAQADLLEIVNNIDQGKVLHDAAQDELAFIKTCIDLLHPYRQFKHLPDPQAHEAAQRDEWKYELMQRAENYLMTTNTIPPDHFATMRMHPDFEAEILPWIGEVRKALLSGTSEKLLSKSPVVALLVKPLLKAG